METRFLQPSGANQCCGRLVPLATAWLRVSAQVMHGSEGGGGVGDDVCSAFCCWPELAELTVSAQGLCRGQGTVAVGKRFGSLQVPASAQRAQGLGQPPG